MLHAGRVVPLVRPSVLALGVGQIFFSSTCESFLKLEVNADYQLYGSSPKSSIQIAINALSVMWSNNIGRCSCFVCNSERDEPVRRWSGILMCGGLERFESLRYVRP